MFRIILLFILQTSILLGADYNIILTNDDQVGIMSAIIDGIDYFLGIDNVAHEGADRYLSFVGFVLVLGTTWALIQLGVSAVAGNAAAGFKHYFIYIVMLFFVAIVIYGPKSSVLIQTREGTTNSFAEEVPTFFAFTLSAFTTIRYELSDITETAYNIPDPSDHFASGGTGGLGYLGGEIALSKLSLFNYSENDIINSYLRDCILLSGDPVEVNNLKSSTNLRADIDIISASSPFNENLLDLAEHLGGYGTCEQLWKGTGPFATLDAGAWETIDDLNVSESTDFGQALSALGYLGAITDGSAQISTAAQLKDASIQIALSNEFKNTFAKMGMAGKVAAQGAAQTMMETQISGVSTGLYVSEQLPRAGFLLFALMIAATPFLFAFALFPGSAGILINFLKTLLWISLWEPMANILGIFQDFYFAQQLKDNGYSISTDGYYEVTISNMANISSEAAALAGMAGAMYVAVQGLSWLLITGSGQMMGNLLSATAQNFSRYSSADTQMTTGEELKSTQLMSEQEGRHVSHRERLSMRSAQISSKEASLLSAISKVHGGATTPDELSSTSSSLAKASTINTVRDIASAASTSNTLDNSSNSLYVGSKEGSYGGNQAIANSNAIHKTGNNGKSVAIKQAATNITAPDKEMKATKEHYKTNDRGAAEQISDATSIKSAELTVGTNSKTAAHGNVSSALNDTSQNQENKGYEDKANASALRILGPNKNERNAVVRSKENIIADDKRIQNLEQAQAKLEQEAVSLNEQADNIRADQAILPTHKEAKKNIEVANIMQNGTKSAGEVLTDMHKNGATPDQVASQVKKIQENPEQYGQKGFKQKYQEDMTASAIVLANSDKTQEDYEAYKNTTAALTKQFEETEANHIQILTDNSKVQDLSEQERAGYLDTQAEEKRNRKDNLNPENNKNYESQMQAKQRVQSGEQSMESMIFGGIAEGAETEQFYKSLSAAGFTSDEIGRTKGLINAMNVAGETRNQRLSGEQLYGIFKDNEAEGAIREMIGDDIANRIEAGIADTNDYKSVTAAANGLNRMNNNIVVNGKNIRVSTTDNGGRGASTTDSSQNVNTGTNIEGGLVGDGIVSSMGYDTTTMTKREIQATAFVSNVINQGAKMLGGEAMKKGGRATVKAVANINKETFALSSEGRGKKLSL